MNNAKEFRKAMDGLYFSDEQKAAMTAMLSANASPDDCPAPSRRRRPLRTALIAAVVCAFLVIGAGAANIIDVGSVLSPIFGGSAAQTEVIDKIGHPIDASATCNGVTIRAEAIIGDKYSAAIVYSITRDDGSALLPEDVSVDQLMLGGFGSSHLGGLFGGSHGSAWFVDEVPGDSTIQYVETISSENALNQGTVTASFNDLRMYDSESETPVIVEGNWKFRFKVEYEDCSVVLGDGETFELNGMGFTINEVRVSPIAVRVDYSVDSEIQWSNAESGRMPEEDTQQMQLYFDDVEIILTLTDGTQLDLSSTGGSIAPGHGTTNCVKSDFFEEIIPLEEMASITVSGVTYFLGE